SHRSSTLMLFLFSYCYVDHPSLHSFPTRRSSDLFSPLSIRYKFVLDVLEVSEFLLHPISCCLDTWQLFHHQHRPWQSTISECKRSEEHTSELQSRFDLVCRLLLEKKK